MINVGIISIHSAPYKDDIYKQLSNQEGLVVSVYTMYNESPTHKEWEKTVELPYNNIYSRRKFKFPIFGDYHKDVITFLIEGNFDIVLINGYYPITNFKAYKFLKKNNIDYIYCSDAVESSKSKLGFIFDKRKREIISNAKSVWVPGKMSKDFHIKEYGINEKNIFLGSYTMNNKQVNEEIIQGERDIKRLRNNLEINNDDFVILFVGKLIKTRNITLLLDAFNELTKKYENISLLIIGDGDENNKVIDSKSLNKKIYHIEKVTFEELHKFYGIVDLYVHPGREPYSLALVEAIIAGLPVISTEKVGASIDFIDNGKNGFIISENSLFELKTSIEKVINNDLCKKDIKKAQEHIINNRSSDWAACQLLNIIKSVKDEI